MGMFDWLCCEYPLPDEPNGASLHFQTKDTPNQMLDEYRIDATGDLWVQNYDIEDRSDPKAEGVARIYGMMTRVNERWERLTDFTGTIEFYTSNITGGCPTPDGGYVFVTKDGNGDPAVSWDYTATFEHGHLTKLTGAKTIETERPVVTRQRFQELMKESHT
jgi:secreted PhoX family phosphatase